MPQRDARACSPQVSLRWSKQYHAPFLSAVQAFLTSIIADPSAPIDSLCFVTEGERGVLLSTFNATHLPPSELMHAQQTIHGMLEHWAAATPDAPAVHIEVRPCVYASIMQLSCRVSTAVLLSIKARCGFRGVGRFGTLQKQILIQNWRRGETRGAGDRTCVVIFVVLQGSALSFAELDQRANQLAHRLVALGVGPEVPVGVMMERSLDLIVALLGVLKAGGAYVPMDPGYPPDRLALMLEDSEV